MSSIRIVKTNIRNHNISSLYNNFNIIIPKKIGKVNLEQFEEKIAMGDRISKLGAGREQRQLAPGISSWG
jgi:hypothetical protein